MNALQLASSLLLLSLICCLISCQTVPIQSDVLNLTASSIDTFRSAVGYHRLALVNMYVPWCIYCKRLDPEFEKAATALNARDPLILLAKVDCTQPADRKGICRKYRVKGYPSLKLFKHGEYVSEYTGKRFNESIVNFMRKLA